jgi:hypothetical protein
LAEDDGHSWILKASAERAKEAEDKERIQEVSNAIAERRGRDLVDFLAVVEQKEGWPVSLDCLRRASRGGYAIPMQPGGCRIPLEPMKYREMVFELFSCTGFEPVNCDTMTLLDELENEESSASAASKFARRTEELAADQIALGDTLFFDFSNTSSSRSLALLLEKARRTEDKIVSNLVNDMNADPGLLWFTETGRTVLSELGVKGVNPRELKGDVFLVIQTLRNRLVQTTGEEPCPQSGCSENQKPSNEAYKSLLESIINQDEKALLALGSRYSVPTLNTMLFDSVACYQESESSDGYRRLVQSTISHVIVRALESVSTLRKLATEEDARISGLAISAMGSFYHESAASVLIDIICESVPKETVDTTLSALSNIAKKCPEARQLISRTVHSERPNRGRLRSIYREMPRGLPDWYHLE